MALLIVLLFPLQLNQKENCRSITQTYRKTCMSFLIFNNYYLCIFFSFKWLYFNFVANPPLMCLSALFSSNISLTSLANPGFIFFNLSDTSLCTVVTFRNGRIFFIFCAFFFFDTLINVFKFRYYWLICSYFI